MFLLKKIGAAVLSAVISVASAVAPATVAKIDSLESITKVEENFYVMDYTYDYDINDIVKNGYICTAEMFVRVFGDYLLGTPSANFACTTFNSVTPDGDYLFGRNFDYTEAPSMLVRTDPTDGYASIGMLNLDLIGYKSFTPDTSVSKVLSIIAPYAVVDGINEKGLSVGVLEIENDPTVQLSLKKNINTTSMIRIVLDKAATVDEAVALFGQYDMVNLLTDGCTYHYQVADAFGNSAIIEYVDNEMVVLYPDKADGNAVDYQCATNFLLAPGADDPNGFGQDRYDVVMRKLAETKGVLSETDAAALLEAVSVENEDMNGYICSTLWSCLFNTSKSTLRLCLGNNYDKVYNFSVSESLVSQINAQ